MTFTERQRIADIVCVVVVGAVAVVIALLSLVGCATPDTVFLALPGDDATADARTRPVDPGGPVPRIEWVDAESCRVRAGCAVVHARRHGVQHVARMPHFYEQDYYTPGDHGMPVYDTAAGRIAVAICYDRHYPEVMRGLGLQRADVVVVPQAGMAGEWPDGLYEAELRVAAFQNGYFTALANRVGEEPSMTFAGESFVCDPFGRVIARGPAAAEAIVYADLDLAQLASCHARELFLRDRRAELVPSLLNADESRAPSPEPRLPER